MKSWKVRPVTAHDLPTLFIISSRAHLEGYRAFIPAQHWLDLTERYQQTPSKTQRFISGVEEKLAMQAETRYGIMVVEDEHATVVGYASSWVKPGDGAELRSLFVVPEHQGKGLGAALLTATLDRFKDETIHLYVIKDNAPAIALYKKYGFNLQPSIHHEPFFGAAMVRMERPVNGRGTWYTRKSL